MRAVVDRREDLLATISWIGSAANKTGALEPGDDAGHAAGREAGEEREVSARQSAALAQQVVAFEIGRAQPEPLGEGVVEQHRRATQAPHVVAGDVPHGFPSFLRIRHWNNPQYFA